MSLVPVVVGALATVTADKWERGKMQTTLTFVALTNIPYFETGELGILFIIDIFLLGQTNQSINQSIILFAHFKEIT